VIYLILKMLVYLLLALVAGVAAGWLLRNLAAIKREEEMQRTLADARARVPQFESLMRSRDEQNTRLKEQFSEKDARINTLLDEIREKDGSLRDKDRELKQLAARSHALEQTSDSAALADASSVSTMAIDILDLGVGEASTETVVASDSVDSAAAGQFQADVDRLERDLAYARATTADAVADAAVAEAEVVTLKAALSRAGDTAAEGSIVDTEVEELKSRLRQKAEEYERLSKTLETERRKVVELERERELQNKSLQVLHQQLELERERGQRAAAG